jgi:hypothetical protein
MSVVVILSTVGTSPRRQKCSAAVLFCHRCLRDLLVDGAHLLTDDLRKSVNNAYTHINRPLVAGIDRKSTGKSAPTH